MINPSDIVLETVCRLCGGCARRRFGLVVLSQYQVSYFHCSSCESLQTEDPYWLDEAYGAGRDSAPDNLNNLDTGSAQRNLTNLSAVFSVARSLRCNDVVDVGGGDGLLCRLLRDYGINAYVSDRYASPSYAKGFSVPNFDHPELVTAFEVLEHFSAPGREVAALFEGSPKAVMVSTELYRGQDADWWYLIPETGHHVFFYSEKAFKIIAERYGYALLRQGSYTLFYRLDLLTGLGRRRLSIMLRGKTLRLTRALLSLRRPNGATADFVRARSPVASGSVETLA
jgi:hypothetical protein